MKNQIVHIKDKLPRGAWKMGKVDELIVCRDGEIRSAKVLLPSGCIVNRPINLLYPIETAIPEDNEKNGDNDISKDDDSDEEQI